MDSEVAGFLTFCRVERRLAELTCTDYERDVQACLRFLSERTNCAAPSRGCTGSGESVRTPARFPVVAKRKRKPPRVVPTTAPVVGPPIDLDSAASVLASIARSTEFYTDDPPLFEAQQLMYDAFEAEGRRRVELARRALSLSPDCADAYLLLAEDATADAEEARALLEQGVAAGERALGPRIFAEGAGYFWGLVETRPYMRARAALAALLWKLGRREEALEHARELLRLNPNDNQGIRYQQAKWLL